MRKKIFTLAELAEYVKTGRSFQYCAKDENEELKVLVDSVIKYAKDDSGDDTEGLLPVILQACHTEGNINGSYLPEKATNRALKSFSNRPILAYIHEVNGQPEFYGHNMQENDDGSITYFEQPVGIIPESCGAHLEYDEEKKKTYVVVKGYIYEEYSQAAEILERESECSCSVELSVRELSYSAKEKLLVFDNFYFSGVTILGKDDNGKEVKPGMVGSNISLFNSDNETSVFNETNSLIEILEKLNATLSSFNINDNQTGKEETTVTLFERLLEQYGKTVEDITFEYEGLSDEELEKAFAEAFGEADPTGDPEGDADPVEPEGGGPTEPESDSEGGEPAPAVDPEPTGEPEGNSDPNPAPENEDEGEGEPQPAESTGVEFSVSIKGEVKTFSLSLNQKLDAMFNLVNATYSDVDGDLYSVEVFEDTKTVEMHGMFTGKAYRQMYKLRSDEFSLVGDRVEIFCKWMTEDELNQFENMKANYAALEQYKNDKEAEISHNEKMTLLVDYSSIADTEEYKELVSNIDTYSNDEVVEKANAIVGKYALKGFNFSAKPEPKPDRHFCGFANNKGKDKKVEAPSYANFLE